MSRRTTRKTSKSKRRKKIPRQPRNYREYGSDRKLYGQSVADYNNGFVAGWTNGASKVAARLWKIIDQLSIDKAIRVKYWSPRLRAAYEFEDHKRAEYDRADAKTQKAFKKFDRKSLKAIGVKPIKIKGRKHSPADLVRTMKIAK